MAFRSVVTDERDGTGVVLMRVVEATRFGGPEVLVVGKTLLLP